MELFDQNHTMEEICHFALRWSPHNWRLRGVDAVACLWLHRHYWFALFRSEWRFGGGSMIAWCGRVPFDKHVIAFPPSVRGWGTGYRASGGRGGWESCQGFDANKTATRVPQDSVRNISSRADRERSQKGKGGTKSRGEPAVNWQESLSLSAIDPLTSSCARPVLVEGGMNSTELVLHETAALGDYHELQSLVMIGRFDVNHKDEDFGNRTALHWAASKGELGRACALLVATIVLQLNVTPSSSCP